MTIICIAIAIISGVAAAQCYRYLPAGWLCDYGEAATDKHLGESRHLAPWYYAAFAILCAISALAALRIGTVPGIFAPLVCAVLLMLAKADSQYGILPNQLMIMAAVLAIPLAFRGRIYAPFLGAGIAGGVCCVILFTASKLFCQEAVGFGDVWLCTLGGYICGYGALSAMMAVSIVSAAASYGVQILAHRLTVKSTAPLGPYLVLGIMCAVCFGQEWDALIRWYFALLGR